MHIEHHYQWRYQDHLGKWRTTNYLCSEQSIKKQHPDATPIEGTLRVLEVGDSLEDYWRLTRANTFIGKGPGN